MESSDLLVDGLGRVNHLVHRVLEDLPFEMLNTMPSKDTNSIGWLLWHLTRVHDHHLSDLEGVPQIWTSQKIYTHFAMEGNENETGNGHTLEQVKAFFAPNGASLSGYNDAVFSRTKKYLEGLNSSALERVLNEPQYDPMPTIGVRLISVLSDNTQHVGQALFVRGMLQGFGWRG
ncbi:MAG: hypothetical protein CL763_05455 [Chloroflexi bacterium]|nr:hypothetical protein [Chloroflexota bacterium]|tara:strand:+ start:346 stop:870 length:525 start_codon:yes stop_codon:yes gene_type:complete